MEEAGLILFLVAIIGYDIQNVNCRDFAYNGVMGPDHWGEQYNTCDGKYQSPININSLDVMTKPFTPIFMTGFNEFPMSGSILNNGHTVVVNLEFANDLPRISKGPLDKTDEEGNVLVENVFEFSQLHFHWGENNTVGSEDRINNVSFPAELHVVFRNIKYKTFGEAVKKSDGITVLAFFFGIQEQDNPHYTEFTDLLELVVKPDMQAKFTKPPMLAELITDDTLSYYTYTGSLTTPPCSEDVTWIDFVTPIMISTKQIERFRRLYTHDGIPLTHNFRPIQPLNNRTVYMATSKHEYDDDVIKPNQMVPIIEILKNGINNGVVASFNINTFMQSIIFALMIALKTILSH